MKIEEKNLNQLLLEFQGPGGRYSYFPFHKEWNAPKISYQSKKAWSAFVKESIPTVKKIDLYIHIPFCEQLCTFCGCNIAVTKDHLVERPYLDQILKEWNFYKEIFGDVAINSIYFGGGTPNFIGPLNLSYLLKNLLANSVSDFHGTIELDPRHVNSQFISLLQDYNIKKFSLGIQDINQTVMENVNRAQDLKTIEKAFEILHAVKDNKIVIDLIYGLPLQRSEQFSQTIKTMSDFPLQEISLYPLAMAKWQKQHQKAFGHFIPHSFETLTNLYIEADRTLRENKFMLNGFGHYKRIGNDNLSNPSRNITGFGHNFTQNLLGLGVGAISTFPGIYWQNQRVLEQYHQQISSEEGHPEKVHLRSEREFGLGNFFEKLICQKEISIQEIVSIRTHFTSDEKSYHFFLYDRLIAEGFLNEDDHNVKISQLGVYFLKNICQTFDPYFLGTRS